MKKKSPKKHHAHKPHKTYTFTITRYIILPLALLLAVVAGKFFFGAATQLHVLGVTTGPVLLADKGSDSSGDSGSGDSGGSNSGSGSSSNNSGSTGSSGGGSSSGGSGSSGSSNTTSDGSTTQTNVGDSTLVDCVGPDGKHFMTSFHDCQELNQKWGNQSFTFTPLTTPTPTPEGQKQETPEATKTHETIQTPQGTLEVQTEGNKGEVNLQTAGLHVQIKQEDNGTIQLTAQQENGTQIALHDSALEKINEALKEKDVEIGTSSAGVTVRSGDTVAQTQSPLSLDPTTQELAVTTPDGTKDVTVLPNQAVQELLKQGVLSSVLASATQNTASVGAALNSVTLTTVNNQPVFQVQGVLNKKVLGLFPVAFSKTVSVSAQTGQILSTQQSLINDLLQLLSF